MNVSKTSTGDEFIQNAHGPLVDNDPITPDEERYVTIDQIPFQITSIAKEKLIDLDNVIFERLVGRPAEEIVDYATDNNIDVIVIANRGIGALEKFVTGSVSDKVTKHANCSVFIVKYIMRFGSPFIFMFIFNIG